MAELNVQPKKRSSNSFLPWLLLALGVIALVFFITRNGDPSMDEARPVAGKEGTSHTTSSDNAAKSEWDGIDFYNAPEKSFNEIKNNEVEVRGNEDYAVYKVDMDDLFDDGSQLKKDADKILNEIVKSINTRFSNGEVRLFGNSDTQNDGATKLQADRMGTMKNWLNQNGLPNLSVHSMAVKKQDSKPDLNDNDDIRIVAMRANN
jgi:hypothetical protein